jgi:hypothetical protein
MVFGRETCRVCWIDYEADVWLPVECLIQSAMRVCVKFTSEVISSIARVAPPSAGPCSISSFDVWRYVSRHSVNCMAACGADGSCRPIVWSICFHAAHWSTRCIEQFDYTTRACAVRTCAGAGCIGAVHTRSLTKPSFQQRANPPY